MIDVWAKAAAVMQIAKTDQADWTAVILGSDHLVVLVGC
jgi:hypothetical protein